MVKLCNISDWYEVNYLSTGGTRNKKIYVNPEDGERYFFKESFLKGNRNYKYEFWSEIIASEVGIFFGFDILPYHIAVKDTVVGCISKSMIDQGESEDLIEGVKFLQAFDPTFNPENTKERHRYTFRLICNSLESTGQKKYIVNLAEVIIFDGLIGNSDRHQENWAIIQKTSKYTGEKINNNEKTEKEGRFTQLSVLIRDFFEKLNIKESKIEVQTQVGEYIPFDQTRFAPIYDSGCSFGRELPDHRVTNMLENDSELEKYVNKGFSEIHWEGNKLNHFELIIKLLDNNELRKHVLIVLERVINRFDREKIKQLVSDIDVELLRTGNPNLFPKERKELVLKLLILRFNKLRNIYSQYK